MLELCDAEDVKKFFSYKMVNTQSIKNDLNVYIEKKLKTIVVKDDMKPLPSMSFERVLKERTTRSKFKKRRSSNFKYSSSNVF